MWLFRELTVWFAAAAQIALLNPQAQIGKDENTTAPAGAGVQDFVSRPLFLPTRRPMPKPAPPVATPEADSTPAPPPTPDPVTVLLGVVVTPGGREAIVRVDDGSSRSLAVGEEVGTWSLKQVFEDHVIFSTPLGERPLLFVPHMANRPEPEVAASVGPKAPVLRRRP